MTNDVPHEVRIARIGKPHGIRGEVTVELFTDSPDERFREGNVVTVRGAEGPPPGFGTLTIAGSRWNKHILLLKFAEISDRNTAETMRDHQLFAPAHGASEESESWYADELVGLAVYMSSMSSDQIGEVTALITGAAQDLIEVKLRSGSRVLVPFVEEIVPEIDTVRGAIVITPPPGLLELNQD